MDNQEISESQKITLETYEKNFDSYLKDTPQVLVGEFKDYMDFVLTYINLEDSILELGSGTGRDADYIESKGYRVFRTELANSFIEYQRKQGKDIVCFNAIYGDLGNKFNVILALAVFLHFNEEEFLQAIQNSKKHLFENGILVLRMKAGEGDEYSDHKMGGMRFFKYWSATQITEVLIENGFTIDDVRETQDGKWIHVIARNIV